MSLDISNFAKQQVDPSELPSSLTSSAAVVGETLWVTDTTTDPAVAVNAAIAASPTRFKIGFGPGVFNLASVPLGIPRSGLGQMVHGAGRGRTVLTLSSAAPRAFDLTKVADYDTYSNVTVEDLTVDCNNVNGALGDHVLLGYGATGTLRFNVNHMRIRRVEGINIPTDATQVNSNRRFFKLYIVCGSAADSAMSIQDVIVEDCRANGGNTGYIAQGFVSSGVAPVTIDNIWFRDLFHDSGIVPSGFFAANNFEIGGDASVGRGGFERCWGRGSGDVGLEADGFTQLSIIDCLMEDAWNNEFLVTAFQAPMQTDTPLQTVVRCRARRSRVTNAGIGLKIANTSGATIGPASVERFDWVPGSGGGKPFSFDNPSTVRVRDSLLNGVRYTGYLQRRPSAFDEQCQADVPTSSWDLDDVGINGSNLSAVDRAGGGNNGTYVGLPSQGQAALDSGDDSSSVLFASASSQKVTLPGPALGATGSIEFWFKWTAGGTLMRDNTSTGGYIIGFDNAATFAVRVNATTVSTSAATSAVQNGAKHHLVVTVTGTTVTIYLDGAQVGTGAYTAATSALPWHVSENGSAAQYTDSTIAKIRMYPTALSAARVLAHYNAGK